MRPAALAVLEYHLAGYRRAWRSTVVSSLTRPVLFFVGFGLALGLYVDRSGTLGMPYLVFIAPGLLAHAGMEIALSESGFPVLTHFKWQRIYAAMASAPLRVVDMVIGRLAYIALRVALATVAFVLVMSLFGVVGSAWVVVTPLVAALTGVAAAAPMFAFAASVDGPNPMAIVVQVGMLPMMLFSGVFFPVEQLPILVQPVAYALPLWHGVELCRAATLGIATAWPAPAHVGVLGLWLLAGFGLALVRFRKRLTD
jgi:lipooligosaccharide transport system permease protein